MVGPVVEPHDWLRTCGSIAIIATPPQAATIHQSAGAKREARRSTRASRVDRRPACPQRHTTQLPAGHPAGRCRSFIQAPTGRCSGRETSLVFVGDMSDVFFRQPTWVINKVVGTIAASLHIGLLLTRRPGRMRAYFTAPRTPLTLRRQQECLGSVLRRVPAGVRRQRPHRARSQSAAGSCSSASRRCGTGGCRRICWSWATALGSSWRASRAPTRTAAIWPWIGRAPSAINARTLALLSSSSSRAARRRSRST